MSKRIYFLWRKDNTEAYVFQDLESLKSCLEIAYMDDDYEEEDRIYSVDPDRYHSAKIKLQVELDV